MLDTHQLRPLYEHADEEDDETRRAMLEAIKRLLIYLTDGVKTVKGVGEKTICVAYACGIFGEDGTARKLGRRFKISKSEASLIIHGK